MIELRNIEQTDLTYLWHWEHQVANPEWKRWDGPYFDREPEQDKATFIASKQSWVDNPNRKLILIYGEQAGVVTRYEEDPKGGGWWELGVVIYDSQLWGKGFGREVLEEWTKATFLETRAHVVTLTTWSGNDRLVRLAKSLGFKECGRIPEARYWEGRRWDSLKFSQLARPNNDEFAAARILM